ncbi:MAG: peptide-methionine (S)-S-oxide reductase MsrA [Candidatus Bathyarchaeia archaeon]|jgi:peptide-methionine (S)-S-oxide reductase
MMDPVAQLSEGKKLGTLGGGCFWCTEAAFLELKGVEKVESGYSGGTVPNPSYGQVCSGVTGHAEAIQILFDPKIISFKEILQIFFTIHDPTTMNRQGADMGTQYRSVIFYHDAEQKKVAEQVIKEVEASHVWNAPIVTQVVPFETFYKAEDYHQNYFKQNSDQPYCQMIIAPKVAKLRKYYRERLKIPEIS